MKIFIITKTRSFLSIFLVEKTVLKQLTEKLIEKSSPSQKDEKTEDGKTSTLIRANHLVLEDASLKVTFIVLPRSRLAKLRTSRISLDLQSESLCVCHGNYCHSCSKCYNRGWRGCQWQALQGLEGL